MPNFTDNKMRITHNLRKLLFAPICDLVTMEEGHLQLIDLLRMVLRDSLNIGFVIVGTVHDGYFGCRLRGFYNFKRNNVLIFLSFVPE